MVLLINPGDNCIGGNEATLVPPLGLLYIAGVLKKNGFEAEVYDANLKQSTPKKVLEAIREKKPNVIGIKVYHYNINWSKELIIGIRNINPGIIVGLGGHAPSYGPKKIIEKTGADFAVAGEGEIPMTILVRNIAKKNIFYEGVPGITVKKTNGSYYMGPENNRIKNLDELPYPDFDLVGGIKNYSTRNRFSPSAPIFTSRGCPFKCSFCSKHVFKNLVTFRSAENVIQEIIFLKKKYNIRQIDILDDNFTVNKNFSEEILELIIKENINIAFDLKCGVRVESLDEEILRKMKRAGFYKIAFGIESADKKVLELCNKQLDLDKLKKVALLAKKIGFKVSGFFIVGLPGETRESIKKTIQLAKDIKLDVANFCLATPYPGTELYDYVNKYGKFLFDPEGNYEFGFYGFKAFYALPGMDEKEILYRFGYTYRKFYNLPRIAKYCCEMRSLSEFKWFFNAAISVIKGWFSFGKKSRSGCRYETASGISV